ncbi:MAG: anthranilate phosphoribosyltransferase [Dasania sp.]|jgi:anthranilate phosphoribosyltransferase
MSIPPKDSYQTIQTIMALMLKGHDLPIDMFQDLMRYFTSGQAADVEITGFLKIFSEYSLTSDYIIAAVEVLKEMMVTVSLPQNIDAIDCCGTGGDGLNSLNVSTAVAFFLADYGIKVAKHGNRSVTSKSGSADILEHLGYPIQKNSLDIVTQLGKTGLSFMFAPYFHPALKHVAMVRKSLDKRTIFNILGPLLNPANVKRQLIGIYDFKLAEAIAKTLIHFGCHKAIIVTSGEGADELTLSGDNQICYVEHGTYRFDTINAANVGLKNMPITAIQGGNIAFNATAFKNALQRKSSAYYDTILLNAAAALWVADQADHIKDGINKLQALQDPINFQNYI